MVRKDARLRLLSGRIDLEMLVVGSDTALEEQARRAHPFSRSSATCTSNFELIGELKPHLEHVSVDLVVFDVENTEHGSPLG